MIKLSSSPADLEQAAAVLKNGGLAAFPTETVYGLGADAFNTLALARVFEVKGRPRFDPLIIHIANLDSLEQVACLDDFGSQRREQLRLLGDSFWPGPLTLVLPKRREVPNLATARLPTAAIRFPSHPIARQLIELSTGAIAAPSANPFGRLSPTRPEHVIETLGDSIDCIVDGGPCSVGVESTVLELDPVPRILRLGGISREQLEAVIGPVEISTKPGGDLKCDQNKTAEGDLKCDQNKTAERGLKCDHAKTAEQTAVPSPGMLQSHYAPGIPLFLHSTEEMASLPYHSNEAYLFFSGGNRDRRTDRTIIGQSADNRPPKNSLTLSEKGILAEAAANLFEYLHILDKSGAVCIHAETVPNEEIGAAINDRLRRAAVK